MSKKDSFYPFASQIEKDRQTFIARTVFISSFNGVFLGIASTFLILVLLLLLFG